MAKKRKLKTCEKKFILEYSKHGNASKAYRDTHPDKDPARAKQYGYRLLKKPEIAEAIEEAIEAEVGTFDQDLLENINFWRTLRNNPEAKDADRLKASGMIANLRGQFREEKDTNVNVAVNIFDDV